MFQLTREEIDFGYNFLTLSPSNMLYPVGFFRNPEAFCKLPVEVGTIFNPDFNRVQFEAVRSEAGLNRFVMTPTKWIEQTKAII